MHTRALLLVILLAATGCPDGGGHDPESPPAPGGQPSGGAAPASDRIKVKGADEKMAFEIKLKSDGAKVVDPSDAETFRLKAKEGKVKLKDAQDKTLGYVKWYPDKNKFAVKDASEEQKTLFTLRQQADGDWKLEDAADQQLYEVKKRDYGWTVRDGKEQDLYKVKVKEGKTSLRGNDDKTRYYTKDTVSSLGFTALGMDALSEGQRLGLLYQIQAAGK